MRRQSVVALFTIIATLQMAACREESGATGAAGQWIKGKALSVNVGVVGSMQRTPFVTLRNDSDKEVNVTPIKVVAWYSQAGQKEGSVTEGSGEKPPKLRPKEEVEFPFPGVGASEFPQKVRVYVGAEGANDREVFTVNFK